MTSTLGRTTTRETTAAVRSGGKYRAIIVTLAGSEAIVRLKGTRKSFRLPVAQLFSLAVQTHLAAVRHARKAARDAKRKSRAA